jgi:hypothetical protein
MNDHMYTEVTNEFVEGDRVLKPTTLFSVEAQICPEAPSLLLVFANREGCKIFFLHFLIVFVVA